MDQNVLETIENNWGNISNFFTYPKNEDDYREKVDLMESLLEKDYSDEHPLSMLINILGDIIDRYELENFSKLRNIEEITTDLQPVDVLKHLMVEYNLKQNDLVDVFGSQGYVSDIINGKREINLRHIKALCEKFNIKPEFFL